MLKRMPEQAKKYLCNIYNRMWHEFHFSNQWNTAIVIPIHKPEKNHTNSTFYRPITLTGCICKPFEWMIDARLIEYLKIKKNFANIKCGGRQERSTLDRLVRLEPAVRTAFALGKNQISIFFELQKAYDMTWRGAILRDKAAAGLRQFLPKYIEQFFKTRYFKVRVQDYTTKTYCQHNGCWKCLVL